MSRVAGSAYDRMGPVSVDYSALFVPVSRDEIAKFKQQSRASAQPWAQSSIVTTVIASLVGAVLVVVVVGMLAAAVPVLLLNPGSSASIAFLAWPVLVLAFGGAALYLFLARAAERWESLLRRTRFASANGLAYLPGESNPAYPGLIFSLGDGRRSSDVYRARTSPHFDIGNYRYTTGSGKEKVTHAWGYLALRLERRLPQMVLDARGNNGLLGGSTLPTSFRADQKLSLEGDFDRHFTLYCPRQYERDALYVFTPDLMALLIDESAAFDVEIVDDWMFVYSLKPFALDQASTVDRLLRIIRTVGMKALSQTDRYADERIGDPDIDLVAPQGQRLKKGITLASVGVIAVAAAVAISFVRFWL